MGQISRSPKATVNTECSKQTNNVAISGVSMCPIYCNYFTVIVALKHRL